MTSTSIECRSKLKSEKVFVIDMQGERSGGAERVGRRGVRLMIGESESGCGWREGVDIWCDSGNDGNIKATKEATLADSHPVS